MSGLRAWVIVRRVLVVVPILPWLLAYGVMGVVAVVASLRSFAGGDAFVHLGYDYGIGAWRLLADGVWLVLAFAVLVTTVALLVAGLRDARYWAPVIGMGFVLLGSSVVWVGTMQLELGESATIWTIACWPMVAVPALLIGRRLEVLSGSTF